MIENEKDLARALARVEEHNRAQDGKLSEILEELKNIKKDIVKYAEQAIHNEYALKAIHERADKLEAEIKEIKGKIKNVSESIKGNVTWPGVVALICRAGTFFGGLTVIGIFVSKILKGG